MTDETAQAILALTDGDWLAVNPSDAPYSDEGNINIAELKRMAKFWLLKDEIEHAVRLVATVSVPHRDLFAKIEAPEAE